jgi:uncharacterized protein (TIGR00296 family)
LFALPLLQHKPLRKRLQNSFSFKPPRIRLKLSLQQFCFVAEQVITFYSPWFLSFFMLSLEEGTYAVKLARKAIEAFLKDGSKKAPDDAPEPFKEKLGVFVTLKMHPSNELRGCIGFPTPFTSLAEGIVGAAISAATEDPRFPPVKKEELDKLVIDVSVLTKPEEIKAKPTDRKKEVKVGRDGLVIEMGHSSGLLLPQVPIEQKWDEEEFLAHTCWKAGLPPDSWLSDNVKLYKFQAQVFAEESPGGKVSEEKLGPSP